MLLVICATTETTLTVCVSGSLACQSQGKANSKITIYNKTIKATRAKALECWLDMVMPLTRPPLVCLSEGGRTGFGGFPLPVVDINIMH